MRKLWAGALLSAGLAATAPLHAETWSCAYDGTWRSYNSSEKGVFNWRVVWQGRSGEGWQVTGDYSDRYGQSVLDGECGDRSCHLRQIYQTGELKGKEYFWKGDYSDESAGRGKTINRFEGTWGDSPSARDGSWRATATCVPH